MAKRTAEQSTGQMKLLPSREQIEEQIREELRTRMHASMLEVVYAIFEEEKEQVCGKPWARKEPGQGRRVVATNRKASAATARTRTVRTRAASDAAAIAGSAGKKRTGYTTSRG